MSKSLTLEQYVDQIKLLNPNKRLELIEKFSSSTLNGKDLKTEIRKYLGLDKLPNGCSLVSIKYYEARGWSPTEALSKVKEFSATICRDNSPYKIEHWVRKGYSPEQAAYKIKSLRPVNVEYWLEKGFSNDEAKQKVFDLQQENSRRSNANHYKGRMPTQVEYWLVRQNPSTGVLYTKEEALAKVAERQDVNSADWFVNTYGYEKGVKLKIERTLSQQKVVNMQCAYAASSTYDIYKLKLAELENTSIGGAHASKASLVYFAPLYQILSPMYEVFVGAFGSKEYKIVRDDKKGFFRYDFTIPDVSLIIEFDGYFYHDRPKVAAIDEIKEVLARKVGFNVVRISDRNSYEENVRIIKSVVEPLNVIIPKRYHKFKRVYDSINLQKPVYFCY